MDAPVSTFGHTSLVATDRTDGTLEPDAVFLEFTAQGAIDTRQALRALFQGLQGRFRLLWFADKQAEYDLKDRDLWVYPVKAAVRVPSGLAPGLAQALPGLHLYRFPTANCADRAFQLFTERRVGPGGTRPLAVPLEELREVVGAGWTDPPFCVRSTHGRYLAALAWAPGSLQGQLVEIRGSLRDSLRCPDPVRVMALRNEALALAKAAIPSSPPAPLPADTRSGEPTGLRRGPDLRAGLVRERGLGGGAALQVRAGSFDWVHADAGVLQASSLEILSAEARLFQRRARLDRLTFFRLDAQEVPSVRSEGLVRWVDLSWNRIPGRQDVTGREAQEWGLSLGSGWGWKDQRNERLSASLGPLLGAGMAWRADAEHPGAQGLAYAGLRGQVQVRAGRTPRLKLSGEWRGWQRGSAFRSQVALTWVPWESPGLIPYATFKTVDGKWVEAMFGVCLPLR